MIQLIVVVPNLYNFPQVLGALWIVVNCKLVYCDDQYLGCDCMTHQPNPRRNRGHYGGTKDFVLVRKK